MTDQSEQSFLTKLSCKSLTPDHNTSAAPQMEQIRKNFLLYPDISNKVHNPTVISLNGKELADC